MSPDFTGCQFFTQIRPLVAEGDCLLGIIRGLSAKHPINARYKNGICTIYKRGTSAMHLMKVRYQVIGCSPFVYSTYAVLIPCIDRMLSRRSPDYAQQTVSLRYQWSNLTKKLESGEVRRHSDDTPMTLRYYYSIGPIFIRHYSAKRMKFGGARQASDVKIVKMFQLLYGDDPGCPV